MVKFTSLNTQPAVQFGNFAFYNKTDLQSWKRGYSKHEKLIHSFRRRLHFSDAKLTLAFVNTMLRFAI